ncbi:thiosulfate sulfurtransferase RDL2, mitochondrial [Colletotrichum spaethianum]|uniref:Thiosulfate sulfurtransferase RDL2, mitochondrial n=1 Tax=Colletotrichum spaethianum TaxID=700344 RepID=A0AA37URA3_9PEZI|nr:thiosulfate sulfurtransferase RDL2, mitochondrial [Colletotrichum spaethianum]GKT50387.1 thiosulfate sulfurtransferase RDL2, mitochondrial [Colletotrichum spaethianum]
MPVITTKEPASAVAETLKAEASEAKPAYLVVYASHRNGRSWCGDCTAAEPYIEKKFGGDDNTVRVVYAGLPEEWRTKENPWRQAPFNVTNLPTLIKVSGEKKWEKLVEADVYDQKKLDSFVGGNSRL